MNTRDLSFRAALLGVLVGALWPQWAGSATRYDPALRFRTLVTRHFVIYFHAGEDDLARRLAEVAEQVHTSLTARTGTRPRGRTHVILVDQTDRPNGWASPLPYNTIEITAAAPGGADLLGNTDDWLTLVFAHEYAHVLHLDRSEGFAAGLRWIFGRAPFVFPNLFLPLWQIEGVATFHESAYTGRGRLQGGDFRAIVDEAARAGRVEPVDRASGGLIDWPGGQTPYAYGGAFHQYLADRFGDEKLAALAKRTAGRLFYTSGGAFSKVFGQTLNVLWRDFARIRAAGAPTGSPTGPRPRRLTSHGFVVAGPRFGVPGGHPLASPARLVYSVWTPHDFPALFSVGLDGSMPSRLASRYAGEQAAVGKDAIYFDQLERVRNVALYSDLYALDLSTARVGRLSRGARLMDPDLSPDGQSLACVMWTGQARGIAIVPVEPSAGRRPRAPGSVGGPVVLVANPEARFATPRWSPDGRWLAAERQILRGPSEIVLIDLRTRAIRTLVSATNRRHVAPTWMPDGRTLVFASDRDGGPFNLYAVTLDIPDSASTLPVTVGPLRRVTNLASGAASPAVSPDGSTLVYVGYTVDGFDLFALPVDPATWQEVDSPAASTTAPEGRADPAPAEPATLGRYSPRPTLWPRFWLPIVELQDEEVRIGAMTAGTDALGRHAYGVTATWRASDSDLATDTLDQSLPDWRISYAYDRWRPTWSAAASRTTATIHRDPEGGLSPAPPVGLRRERKATAGVYLPVRRVRFSQAWLGAFQHERLSFVSSDRMAVRERNAIRLGWSFQSAKAYGYSISPEEGLTVGIASEHVRRGLGADGTADAATAEFRGFRRAGGRHAVLAVRAGAGVATGDRTVRRVFELGGGKADGPVLDFDGRSLSLMRGFQSGAFAGRHLALVNMDYRWPWLRVERGRGTWPVFVRTLHAALFADMGHAWNDHFSLGDLKVGVGAEVSLDAVVGHVVPLTGTVGVAWGRDGSGIVSGGARTYVRLGRAF